LTVSCHKIYHNLSALHCVQQSETWSISTRL